MEPRRKDTGRIRCLLVALLVTVGCGSVDRSAELDALVDEVERREAAYPAEIAPGSRSDLLLRIAIGEEQQQAIRDELDARQRATPEFEYAFYDVDGQLCAQISNRVAIRPAGYKPSRGALGTIKR